MNITDLGPGHYVATRCPDGRYVIAPYGDAVAPVIRRLNAARTGDGSAPDDPAAWVLVTAWLDERETSAVPLRMIQGELRTDAGLERLQAAADAWYAAPHDSVAEKDAAGEMYEAAQVVLAAAGRAPSERAA